jgi:hypothetical protein
VPTIPYKLKDGTKIVGTTTAENNIGWNKGALMWWANQEGLAGRNHRDTSQKEADAGTVAHYMIDCNIKGLSPNLLPYPQELIDKAETCYLNFLEWKKMVNLRVHKTEINLVSEKYKYGGTPDCIGYVTDKLALLDWKTGSGVYPEMLIQCMAYKQLWEENHPDMPLDGGFHLLRISKEDAAFDHLYRHAIPEAWEAFQCALKLHELHKVLKKK